MHSWNSVGSIEFYNDKGVCSNLVQLDEWIYMVNAYLKIIIIIYEFVVFS